MLAWLIVIGIIAFVFIGIISFSFDSEENKLNVDLDKDRFEGLVNEVGERIDITVKEGEDNEP